MIFSTVHFWGGSDYLGFSIAVDDSGFTYVTGWTYSDDFPTENAYQAYQGGRDVFVTNLKGLWDAFVTNLNSSGSGLIYSTYLGGSNSDYGKNITVGDSGCFCDQDW